jgi:DNA-binding NtrC family response regulator
MPASQKILIVDDEPQIRMFLVGGLKDAGYATDEAGTMKEAMAALDRELPDLVLLDFKLPDGTGLDVLRHLRTLDKNLPVIMLTAFASVQGAVEAMQVGAYDYIGKPFEFEEVLQTVARALEARQLRAEVSHCRERDLRQSGQGNMIAASPAMKEVLRLIGRVATSEASTILLTGESGVGKGVIARMLHYESLAWDKPFMNITCTALPEALLESELFGHEKGAFTDAKVQKKGLFELANGGTIFLDEIGDLSMPMQGKLLRFLEEKSFRRVGGVRDLTVSVRIVAATNKDLAKEVAEKRFRNDLYFRLRVIPITIPPLRERLEDITPLAESFVASFNTEFRKSVIGFSERALTCMHAHAWPGNVRELRNAVERAVLLAAGDVLDLDDLPPEIGGAGGLLDGSPAKVHPGHDAGLPGETESTDFGLPAGGLIFDELERDLVTQALARARGNRTQAARLLGMNRDQIRYRIEKFGLSD